jgi:hypothetical protein
MDKQKQIEEMAQCKNSFGITCNECYTKACDRYSLAKELYNAGYRKIPENAVVLTREEAEQVYGTVKNHGELLKDLQEAKSVFEKEMEEAQKEFVKQFEEHEKEVRKETAEKFAERAKAVLIKAYDAYEALAIRNLKKDDDIMYQHWKGEATATQKSIDLMDKICKEITGEKE